MNGTYFLVPEVMDPRCAGGCVYAKDGRKFCINLEDGQYDTTKC